MLLLFFFASVIFYLHEPSNSFTHSIVRCLIYVAEKRMVYYLLSMYYVLGTVLNAYG